MQDTSSYIRLFHCGTCALHLVVSEELLVPELVEGEYAKYFRSLSLSKGRKRRLPLSPPLRNAKSRRKNMSSLNPLRQAQGPKIKTSNCSFLSTNLDPLRQAQGPIQKAGYLLYGNTYNATGHLFVLPSLPHPPKINFP